MGLSATSVVVGRFHIRDFLILAPLERLRGRDQIDRRYPDSLVFLWVSFPTSFNYSYAISFSCQYAMKAVVYGLWYVRIKSSES